MKAIGYSETGPASVLRDLDLTKPIAGPRDLIVRVETAGVVESVGSEVTLFRPGDAVFTPAISRVRAQMRSFTPSMSALSAPNRRLWALPKRRPCR